MKAMHIITGMILGALAGASGGSMLLGLVLGLAVGVLYSRMAGMTQRIDQLEARLRMQDRGAALKDEPFESDEQDAGERAAPESPWLREPVVEADADAGRVDVSPSLPLPEDSEPPPWRRDDLAVSAPHRGNDLLSTLFDRARDWLTTGNVPVKVGVIVSLVGVSFLLKFAIDRQLLNLPIELRLLGVALFALALVIVGWRLRDRMRVYALSLQGGGVGMLYLTIFAALRLWQLLPPGLAFVLLVLLTVGTAALAVLQNAPALAVFGVVGGFLAPVLTSTGQGSHVVLFGYYLVLNVGILGIAWFRAWRFLNLLGFVFTFVIAGLWGWRYFRPELFATTEPFLLLYFLFYQAIAVLYALRQPPGRIGVVDGTLVFGTPAVAFALQFELVRNMDYGLAVSAASLAIFYAATATVLYRRSGEYLRLLSESFIALAVAFATLAIPLALDARWTSAAWALEGAALVWIGVRQHRHLANLAGLALLFFSGAAFALNGWQDGAGLPVVNGNVLGGLLVSLGSLFASRRLRTFADSDRLLAAPLLARSYRLLCAITFCWGTLWWLGTAWAEISDRIVPSARLAMFLLFLALSALVAARLGERRAWPELRIAAQAYLPLLALLTMLQVDNSGHFLFGLGLLAWPAALATQYVVLRSADRLHASLAGAWHVLGLAMLSIVLATESWWRVMQLASAAWAHAAALAVVGIVALTTWRMRDTPAWPVPAHPVAYLGASLAALLLQISVLTLLCLTEPGDPSPIPYLPLLNPYDLSVVLAALLVWIGLKLLKTGAFPMVGPGSSEATWLARLVALAFVVMTSASLVRGIHFQTGVPWRSATLFDSVMIQTALSIYWGILGFVGMVMGARRAARPLWLAGAAFMALVVVKLFLVDLGNSGTVERIVSFIGVGALLLIVGYFAPVPPRLPETRGEDMHES